MNTPPPARYNFPYVLTFAAISGATIDVSRPQLLANPAAEPRTLDGNASGVHPYKIALKADWKKYSMAFSPTEPVKVVTVAYRKSEVAIIAEVKTMAHFRPNLGTSTRAAPRRTPGMPAIAMTMLKRNISLISSSEVDA
jgi:hypothetical protein